MKTKSRKLTTPRLQMNWPLKLAIVTSEKTARQIAQSTRIPETRLSGIIHGRSPEPTDVEKRALARVLAMPVEDLFPITELQGT